MRTIAASGNLLREGVYTLYEHIRCSVPLTTGSERFRESSGKLE